MLPCMRSQIGCTIHTRARAYTSEKYGFSLTAPFSGLNPQPKCIEKREAKQQQLVKLKEETFGSRDEEPAFLANPVVVSDFNFCPATAAIAAAA